MGKEKRNRNKEKSIAIPDNSGLYLKIIKIGIYLALFLPLMVVPSHLYPFSVGKVVIFRIIVEVLLFFYIFLMVRNSAYRPRWGLFEIAITLYAAIFFLASIMGVDFNKSFWGTAERMGGFFTFAHYWVFFIITSSVFKSREDWRKLLSVSVFAAVISAIYSLGQSPYYLQFLEWLKSANSHFYDFIRGHFYDNFFLEINNPRPYGTIGNAGFFAAYLLFNVFFGLYLALSEKRLRNRLIFGGAIFFLIFIILISGTRSAYLALMVGFVAACASFAIFFGKSKKAKLFVAGFILLLILGAAFIRMNKEKDWVKSNYVSARFVDISFEGAGVKERLLTWESAWEGFKERPILGWGPENFNVVFNKYFNPLHFTGYSSVTWFDRAHNIILDMGSTMGIMGLTGYAAIYIAMYYHLFKNRKRMREYLSAFLMVVTLPVAYFVQNMFWFDDFSVFLMLFLFWAFFSGFFSDILSSQLSESKNENFGQLKFKDHFLAPISRYINLKNIRRLISDNLSLSYIFMGILLIIMIYTLNIKPWAFQDKIGLAVYAFNKNTENSFELYKRAMADSTYLGRYEGYKKFSEYINNTYTLKTFNKVSEQEVLKSNLNFSIREMKSAIAENPNGVNLYLELGRVYNKYYNFFYDPAYLDEAEKILSKGLDFSPKREMFFYELGQTMIFKKNYPGAIENFRRAAELNPNVPVSHWYLGMAYANAQKFPEAKQELDKAIALGYDYRTNIKDTLSLAHVYVGLKDYETLARLYAQAIDREPNNPDLYASLAALYKEVGDNAQARKMAEKAISLDASYAAEGQEFLKSLGQ